MSRSGEVEFVRDGVDVGFVLIPPNATYRGGVVGSVHVVENPYGLIEVSLFVSEVVHSNPCQCPPPFVIVEAVEKAELCGVLLDLVSEVELRR